MATIKKSNKKASAKKASAKKEKKVVVITRKNFPDKGWGFTPEQHDKIAAIGIKNGFRNLSQVIRSAMEIAYKIK